MVFKIYINDSDLLGTYFEKEGLEVISLNGKIYRGDTHNMWKVADRPKYFGTETSSKMYLREGSFLKAYITKQPLLCLNLTNSKHNVAKVINFIRQEGPKILRSQNMSDEEIKWKIAITVLLLQMFQGFVLTSYSTEIADLPVDKISKYLKDKGFDEDQVEFFYEILEIVKQNPGLKSSRVSFKDTDLLLNNELKSFFTPLGIQGYFFIANYKEEYSLCKLLKKEYGYYNCVPTEICIFHPPKYVRYVGSLRLSSGQYIKVPKNHQ